MRLDDDNKIIFKKGEPALRSCPECNSGHEYLRDVEILHLCFVCGRYWLRGHYLDEFETIEALRAFLQDVSL